MINNVKARNPQPQQFTNHNNQSQFCRIFCLTAYLRPINAVSSIYRETGEPSTTPLLSEDQIQPEIPAQAKIQQRKIAIIRPLGVSESHQTDDEIMAGYNSSQYLNNHNYKPGLFNSAPNNHKEDKPAIAVKPKYTTYLDTDDNGREYIYSDLGII